MKFHNIIITVFLKPEEDKEKIRTALKSIIPFNLEENKIKIEESKAEGFNEREILIYEVKIEKQQLIKKFIDNLIENLSEKTKEMIFNQIDSRTDEDCRFYLRFSKEKLIKDNEFFLTDQGNCFHIKMAVAAFPKKKEKAMDIIQKVFIPIREK